MLDSARLFHLLKFAIPLAIFLCTLLYLSGAQSSYTQFLRQFKDEKKLFVADFLEHEIDGRFDGAPIQRLCDTRKWTPGLIMSCDPHPGGVGEVKNAHLHCIRVAMELGAEMILPQIVKRNDHDITKLVPGTGGGPQRGIPLDYYFDLRHLNDSLAAHCPQMKLHRSIDDFHDVPSMLVPIKLSIGAIAHDFVNGTVLAKPAQLGKLMWDLINVMVPETKRTFPLRVHLATPTFLFPTAYDPPDFAANFGRLLRVRHDARALAAAALFNLQKTHGLSLDPRRGLAASANATTFAGVHLRTERDVAGRFPDYETQAANYLNYAVQNHARLVFLATGASADNATAFALRARDFDLAVVAKRDVLEGDDLARLDALSWDQRALVDYEIMLRAGLVAGVSDSSFAWNLAMRRTNAYHGFGKSLLHTTSDTISWKDQYSTIFGRSKAGEAMQLTIWP